MDMVIPQNISTKCSYKKEQTNLAQCSKSINRWLTLAKWLRHSGFTTVADDGWTSASLLLASSRLHGRQHQDLSNLSSGASVLHQSWKCLVAQLGAHWLPLVPMDHACRCSLSMGLSHVGTTLMKCHSSPCEIFLTELCSRFSYSSDTSRKPESFLKLRHWISHITSKPRTEHGSSSSITFVTSNEWACGLIPLQSFLPWWGHLRVFP